MIGAGNISINGVLPMKRIRRSFTLAVIIAAAAVISCETASVRHAGAGGQLGRYLVQLENSVAPQYQTDGWTQRRMAWINDVHGAGDEVRTLRGLLLELETGIRPQAYSPGWFSRRISWLGNVQSARTISDLAGLVLELENSIHINSQFSSWRGAREVWVAGVRSLMSEGTAEPTPAEQGQFGELLISLETSVLFQFQTPAWPGRRPAWIQDVRGAGGSLERLRRLLLEFEREILVTAQDQRWLSASRNAWLQRVQGATSMGQLAGLMLEVEQSINYNAQSPNWRTERPGWMTRVRALQSGGAAQDPSGFY
jgi:hypothetical protein